MAPWKTNEPQYVDLSSYRVFHVKLPHTHMYMSVSLAPFTGQAKMS